MKNLILLFAIALLAAGCTSPSAPFQGAGSSEMPTQSSAIRERRLTLMAVDNSQSTLEIRGRLLQTALDIGTAFDPRRDSFRAFRFGHKIDEFYSQLPEDDDAFAITLAKYVKPSDPVGGTDYPAVLERLAQEGENASEREIRIVIVGDGQNDYSGAPGAMERYRKAAQRLAKNPRVVFVRWWGVDIGTREEIRTVCAPLGPRAQLQSLDQNPLAP